MSKKKKREEFPTVERLSRMGFQDGYSDSNSKEDELLSRFCKKGINSEQIASRILAYSLGYKKGKLVLEQGLNNCKIINGEVAVNGETVKLDDIKKYEINEKIKTLSKTKKKKGRRK